MRDDDWNECNFVGDIRVYPLNDKYVDNLEGYDERMRGESQWKDME